MHTQLALQFLAAGVSFIPVSLSCSAATPYERPKLVVGITVEGLSLDYLKLLEDNFSASGLGYVLNNSLKLTDVDFGTLLDGTAASTMLNTGAAPTVNGVGSEQIYDIAIHQTVPTLNRHSPSAADENYSPSAILSSTIADELKIDGSGSPMIYSIAPNASMAIAGAGHAGNGAYWINDTSGKWTTSTYYQDRPVFIQYRNRMQPLSAKLDTLSWTPSFNISKTPFLSEIQKEYPFRVHFPYGDPYRYKKYKSASVVNDEVCDVAVEFINNLDLGRHESTDMLSIAFNLQPYPYGTGSDAKSQTIDSYLRLDRNIEKLLNTISGTAGLENTLVYITGTPAMPLYRKDEEKWRIPSGEFSVKRATSLLNLYLIQKFGNGEWIAGYHDGYFYLNPSAIAEHHVDPIDVRKESSAFLKRMAGVAYAYSIDDIRDRRVHDNADAMARNTRVDNAGDILVIVSPGWQIVDTPLTEINNDFSSRHTYATAPAFILHPSTGQGEISREIDARSIAPTIASILRIRPPNGSSLHALRTDPKE